MEVKEPEHGRVYYVTQPKRDQKNSGYAIIEDFETGEKWNMSLRYYHMRLNRRDLICNNKTYILRRTKGDTSWRYQRQAHICFKKLSPMETLHLRRKAGI